MSGNIQSITFGANFINTVSAKKLTHDNNSYSKINLSFVEINPQNKMDIDALSNINKYWQNDLFACNIYVTGKELSEGRLDKNKYKLYAVTTQNNNFKNLKDENILGVVECEKSSKNTINLNYIQIKPDLIYKQIPDYNHIGTGILEALKHIYDVITLKPAAGSTDKFYRNNGFKPIDNNSKTFIWKE